MVISLIAWLPSIRSLDNFNKEKRMKNKKEKLRKKYNIVEGDEWIAVIKQIDKLNKSNVNINKKE